jgi:hypothetical protein
MGNGIFASVPARFAGFQAFENRFLFPGDGEVVSEKSLDHLDGRGCHRCTPFRLVRIQSVNTSGETKKPPSPVKGRAVSARGTTPLRHSLSVCDLYLCSSVVTWMLRHSNSGNGESFPSPPTENRPDSVRSEARRSYSPAFPIPLLSYRGSLFRSGWLLVLVNACRVRMSATTVAQNPDCVNSKRINDCGWPNQYLRHQCSEFI